MSKPIRFAKLARQFPVAFKMLPRDRRPLVVGIQDELDKLDTGLCRASRCRTLLAHLCLSASRPSSS